MLPPGTDQLIERTLSEDIGDGDHTTLATIPESASSKAHLLVKQDCVIAGLELAQAICRNFDDRLHLAMKAADGDHMRAGDTGFIIEGPARSILTVERLVLNFMQRMSGIATLTYRFVQAVEGTGCRVYDTRKTTPGLRAIEKWAVRIGGGHNHRHGLHDMILIKDNHADFCGGGLGSAIAAAREYLERMGRDLPIVVEARNMAEVDAALAAGPVQRILLDNFAPTDLEQAVKHIAGRVATESSGGITLQTVRSHAETGVDMVSVGALTHSVVSIDLSLKAI